MERKTVIRIHDRLPTWVVVFAHGFIRVSPIVSIVFRRSRVLPFAPQEMLATRLPFAVMLLQMKVRRQARNVFVAVAVKPRHSASYAGIPPVLLSLAQYSDGFLHA